MFIHIYKKKEEKIILKMSLFILFSKIILHSFYQLARKINSSID